MIILLYDTYVQADASGNYSIPFYKGTYYVFGYGFDMDIPSPYIVKRVVYRFLLEIEKFE